MTTKPGNGGKVALPGANKIWRTLPGGRVARDWYAWRGSGAPHIGRFEGATRGEVIAQENSVEGAQKLADAYGRALRPEAPDTSTLGGVLHAWSVSDAFNRRSYSTKYNEKKPLEQIRTSELGRIPIGFLGIRDVKGVRKDMREWLAKVAEEQGPRAADTRKDILSKALNWGIREGLCSANAAVSIPDFAYADRSDIIWTGADVAAFENAARVARRKLLKKNAPEPNAPPPIVLALLLACYTGLRRGDLCNLAWRDVGPNAITLRPQKSVRRRQTAGRRAPPVIVIPRTPELNAVLEQLKPANADKQPWVLTNSRKAKWSPMGLTSSFIKVRDEAGIHFDPGNGEEPVAKTLHDARGTFVTHMRCLGYAKEEVAEMVGWEVDDVDRIAKRYADAETIALAWLERLKKQQREAAKAVAAEEKS